MNPQLGVLVDSLTERDAIHVAIMAVKAGCALHPGQHVGFIREDSAREVGPATGRDVKAIGIIDPFLKAPVPSGAWCYLVLYPNTITSLRHDWEHPDVDAKQMQVATDALSGRAKAIEGVQNFASEINVGYDELLMRAKEYLDTDEVWLEGDKFDSVQMPEQFWEWYGVIQRADVPVDKRGYFFSCSC